MKKKEILARLNVSSFGGLIIFVLAVLVTGLSWFYCYEISTPVGGLGLIQRQVCGWPLGYWYQTKRDLNFLSGFLNFLFWFLVLAVGWWLIKKLKSRKER